MHTQENRERERILFISTFSVELVYLYFWHLLSCVHLMIPSIFNNQQMQQLVKKKKKSLKKTKKILSYPHNIMLEEEANKQVV